MLFRSRSALASVDAALAKAGTDKSKILEATIWLANIVDDYNGMNKVYDSWIVSGKPPARACIQAKLASENYRIEIRVIAATRLAGHAASDPLESGSGGVEAFIRHRSSSGERQPGFGGDMRNLHFDAICSRHLY